MGESATPVVPLAILDLLGHGTGAVVDIGCENGRMIVQPNARPSCILGQPLAECDRFDADSDEDRAWFDDKPVSEELQ